jgi:FMN-dependent NADH-azoreductase
MTEAESNIWERIQSLTHRFQNADRSVLGTPMWNFGLPYKLKHLIDPVAQRNLSVYLRRQTVWPSFERGKGNCRLYTRFHVSWRVLLYRRRYSITKQPIWTFGCGLVGVRDLRSAIVDNAWNRDRQESEVSLAKGKATLERLVEWFFSE